MAVAELVDTQRPVLGSPEWWLKTLSGKLQDRQSNLRLYDDYYEGRHKLAFATDKFRKAFGGLFGAFADNWMAIVVDAVVERLTVEGFRFPMEPEFVVESSPESVAEITTGDTQAWDIWQANNLDSGSEIGHTEANVHGMAYVLVGPGAPYPLVTVESAYQSIIEYAPGYRTQRLAALKRWQGAEGLIYATVYRPDFVYKYVSERAQEIAVPLASPDANYNTTDPLGRASGTIAWESVTWQRRSVLEEEWPLPNPVGVVPMVCLANDPRLLSTGQSEIARVIPIQNAVNKLLADMLVASEFQSFRQRYATGLELDRDPETGQVIDNFKQAIDRLWISADPNTSFGEFGVAELSNFVQAIEMLVQHIASQSRTPPHYLSMLRGQLPSGETLKSAEAGLVAKARRKQRHFGEAWEEAMRLAFAFQGNPKAMVTNAETIWADPERRSEAEHIDAVMKMQALGLPRRALWEELDLSPQKIERYEQLLAAEPPEPATDSVPISES